MKIEVKSGNLILKRSDSVLVYENQPVVLTFDEQFKLSFKFVEDSTLKDQKMDIKQMDEGIVFELINFNNPIGVGTTQPVPFATVDGMS